MELGGQKAMAFGPSSQAKNAATANNYNKIMNAQSSNQGGGCGHNLIYIQAGNQSVLAYGSAVAINKRRSVQLKIETLSGEMGISALRPEQACA